MARTKSGPRHGPEGHAYRENAKKKSAASKATSGSKTALKASEGGNGKRKRNRDAGKKDSAAEEGGAAKRRKGDSEKVEVEVEVEIGEGEDGNATTTASTSAKAHTPDTDFLLVPIFPGLEDTHTVTTMSIISSSNINKKVSRMLELLGAYKSTSATTKTGENGGEEGQSKGNKKGKLNVVMLYAKAPVVSKVVSVAEIVKREIAKEGGKWFSYCAVGEVVRESRAKDSKSAEGGDGKQKDGEKKGSAEQNGDEGGESEEEEEAFEVMKTPFERALEVEGKPKVRAMPVMNVYLSRVRIEGLRKVYGEQTNAQEVK